MVSPPEQGKKSLLTWILVLAAVCISGLHASTIEIREDALDLLPDSIVTSDLELIRRLGMINRVYLSISIDTETTEITDAQWQQLRESVLRVGTTLQESPLFGEVVYRLPPDLETTLFSNILPLLPYALTNEDYRELARAVTAEGVRQRLQRMFQLLNSPAGIGMRDRVVRDPLGLSLILFNRLKQLRGEFAVTVKDGVFTSRDRTSCLIWADALLPLTDSNNSEQVQAAVDRALAVGLAAGVSARVIGTLPHTLANIRTVRSDLKVLLPLATVLLALFLVLACRSPRGVLVVAVPFLAALPAIALQNMIFGKVSALALGFGIVLTGLAVDFAVHLFLALRLEPGSRKEIIRKLRRPILLAWATTTSVFLVLLLSSVPSHRQMAGLAIAGITLAVIISWLLIPTITGSTGRRPLSRSHLPEQVSRKTFRPVLIWILLLGAGMVCLPRLEFNGDMRVLDAVNAEINDSDTHFHETWRGSIDQALVLSRGRDLDQALDVNDRAYAFLADNLSTPFQSVAPILPGPAVRRERAGKWREFWTRHRNQVATHLDRFGTELGFRSGIFTPFITFTRDTEAHFNAEQVVRGPLRPLLASMVRLPSGSGHREPETLVMTIVPENDTTWPVLKELKGQQTDNLNIISFRSWREQVETLLKDDIQRLSLLAALVVIILVGFFFRDLRKTAAALAPVLAALASMAIFSFVTASSVNIMHVLMSIMVIGLSVDYGIFSVCAHELKTTRTTRRAVTICAVSSCIGFGVLALAQHPALFSLGTTVLAGIGAAWPTAAWVTPALLDSGTGRTG